MTDIVTRSLNQMTTWHKLRIAIFAASALAHYSFTNIGAHDSHIKSGAGPTVRELANPWGGGPYQPGNRCVRAGHEFTQ